MVGVNTHYGVITFSGDPAEEHPDPELNGMPPSLELIACGPEEFCWQAIADYTSKRPLQEWQEAEVLVRDISLVEQQVMGAQLDATDSESDDGSR